MLPLIVIFIPAIVICFLKSLFSRRQKVEDVAGKVVMITGASSGLGEACAWKFAEAEAKIIMCARNTEKLDLIRNQMLKKLKDIHKPEILHMDLDCIDDIPLVLQKALSMHGHIDIFINNAGISYRGTIENTEIRVHQHLMNVNYFGAVMLTKALLPSLLERKTGHIVTVSSVQGKIAIPFRSAYAASKHACEAFFNCLRSEVSGSNICVTVVSPGYIRTNLSINAITDDGTAHGAIDPTTASGMEPSHVASEIVEAVERKREEVVLADWQSKIAIILNSVCPSLLYYLMKRRARKGQGKSKKQ